MWERGLFCNAMRRLFSSTTTERLMSTSVGPPCKGYYSPNVVVCGRLFSIKFRPIFDAFVLLLL